MNTHLKYIEDLTLKAIKNVNCEKPPVPIEKIPEKFGLEVVEFPFHNNVSGLLKKEQGVIGVNQGHHPVRKRFTIAHELGHFLLGHEMGKDELVDDSFNMPYPQEREANIFASLILMPTDWVKKSVKENGMNDSLIETLAKEYVVSKQSATIRLLELNLIK